MRSMTGFVQECYRKNNLSIFITIKSYNSRALDIYLKVNLPYVEIEKKSLQLIREFVKRGRIECFINIFFRENEQMEIILNRPAIKKIVDGLREAGAANSLFVNLFEIPGVIAINPSQSLFSKDSMDFIENSLKEAIKKLIKEREREGREVGKEIVGMIRKIEGLSRKIEMRKDYQIRKIKKKVERNLKLLKDLERVEEIPKDEFFSILRRMDITEEIVRIKVHTKEFKKCLESKEPVGKKMEFLAIEIQREATSILSKSEDEKISSFSVQIKDLVEKIKEQLRNIE